MRVIFMGTPDFAAANLEAIYRAGYEISAVVSQPDKPVGRHSDLKPTAVKAKAQELGIETVLQPEKASDPAFLSVIRELKPDVIVVTAYGRILKKELLEIPRFGCINVHASLLPRWRGAAPIQWSVIEGDAEVGVTTMQMDEGLDTGDILLVRKMIPAPDETGGSLFDKLAALGGELIVETLKCLEEGTLTPVPQKDGGSCYAPVLRKEMGCIDWTQDAEKIERLIRGLSPWPGTYTFYGKQMFKIHRAVIAENEVKPAGAAQAEAKPAGASQDTRISGEAAVAAQDNLTSGTPAGAAPGTIVSEHGRLFVICGSGALEILELQPEGKKRMNTGDFLRGHELSGVFRQERA
ncbi:MAG: methionyl-tRNA formyltransferase [Lachnospiraceae bacterium]|nr:methionyl-tRNA formyltransferase [Lachnospiraceae bacterium]